MQIAIDANPIARPRTGIGNYTYHLIRALEEISEHSFLLYYYNLKRKMRQNLYPESLPTVRNLIAFRPLLFWQVRRHRPDLVHGTNYRVPFQGKYGATMTIHDLAFLKFSGLVSLRTKELLRQKIAKGLSRSALVMAVSECTKKDLCEFFRFPEKRVKVTYPGVDEIFTRPCQEEEKKRVLEKFRLSSEYIFFTGSFNARKNLLLLLEAYALLPEAPPLVLAGGEGNRSLKIRKKIVDLKLTSKVKILGYVRQEELPALYQNALFFVYPSLYEGFGLPLLEAMASGTPILASRAGAIQEVTSDAALLVSPRNLEELKEGLGKLTEESALRDKLREKGKKRVALFSWKKTAQETLKVYSAICCERMASCL